MAVEVEIQWHGSEEEQLVARNAFEVLSARGRFYAEDAPIRLSLANLRTYFVSRSSLNLREDPEELAALIERSLLVNSQVFAREEGDSGQVFVSTRSGRPPRVADATQINPHTFRTRLFEGSREPTEEDLKQVRGAREMPEIISSIPETIHAIFPVELPETFEPEAEEEEFELTAPEEEPAAVTVDQRVVVGSEVVDLSADPDEIAIEHGAAFREMLGKYLDEDFRFVQFGGQYYLEDRVERLSKGQLRDIKDYITERNEPLTDEEILSDALRRPLQNADYSLWRFTINYRLSREKKDFRFVGTAQDRIWSATALAPIGQSVRKPADIAADYRYLNDVELSDSDHVGPASGADASGRLELRHVLTWYESENGVLPVGRSMQLLMPNPLLDDQSAVVLRIQDPQNYVTYLAEYRVAMGGRGAYIAGLEELFQSSLVPGAVFSLVQGGASNQFTIEYERQSAQESRLLHWDTRRERWSFGPVVYECPVETSYLLTEERLGQLNGRKRASDAERRRPEFLLQQAFELVGEPDGAGGLTALLDDLLPVVNIDRPLSRQYIESVLISTQYPQFTLQDPSIGLAVYQP